MLTYSQDVAAQVQAPQESGIEDIVVTAQKRSQNLQDVPLAVTAFSGTAIEDRGIKGISDLAVSMPGLQFGGGNGSITPFLRGVGNPAFAIGNESSVAVYVDGVYYTRLPAGFFALGNVERVEVVKGPQGTLFGRNSSGGVIQIVTPDPSYQAAVKGSIGYGNYDTIEGDAYATTGLGDKAALDVSVNGRWQQDGFGRNVVTGHKTSFNNYFTVRSKLLLEPFEGTKLLLSGFYAYSKNSLQGNAYPGTTQGYVSLPAVQLQPLPGYYDQRSDLDAFSRAKMWGVTARLEQDLSFANFVSTTAYMREREKQLFDADYVDRPDFFVPLGGFVRQLTQEFQLSNKAGSPVDWVGGFFYYNTSSGYDRSEFRGPLLFGPGLNAYAKQRAKSYAFYAQATYKITRELSVTGGLRYTMDRVRADGRVDLNTVPVVTVFAPGPARDKVNKLTYKAALDYKPADGILLYASYSRGFKSSSYNLLTYGPVPNKPEVLDAYEVGFKTDLLDRRLRLNGAVFWYDIKSPQVQLVTAGTIILTNAGGERIRGAEIDAQALLAPGLTARLGATYLDPEYTSYPNATSGPPNPLPPFGAIAPFITIDAKGRQTPFASKFTMNAGLDFAFESRMGKITLTADYFYNDGFYFEPDNFLHQGSYNIVNGSARLAVSDQLSLRLWGKNLLNEKHAILATTQTGSAGYPYIADSPRTYGATVSFSL